jgi:predicted heme/steroid binding protein
MIDSIEELIIQKFNRINFCKKMLLTATKEDRLDFIKDIETLTLQIETMLDYNSTRVNNYFKANKGEDGYRAREFNMKDLEKYNGEGDNPAYIAVNGTVYDITGEKLFNVLAGLGIKAGTDLSQEFNSGKLNKQLLKNIRIVGVLKD